MSVRFEPLPALKKPRMDWAGIARQLRARPNEWAVVKAGTSRSAAHNAATRIRRGQVRLLPPEEFEATSRKVGGEHRLYVRHIRPVTP